MQNGENLEKLIIPTIKFFRTYIGYYAIQICPKYLLEVKKNE